MEDVSFYDLLISKNFVKKFMRELLGRSPFEHREFF
jgi:hypothetical protein